MADVSTTSSGTTSSSGGSSPALIALAWLIVILPAAWGLEHTVQNALKIFTRPATPATAPVTPGATTP